MTDAMTDTSTAEPSVPLAELVASRLRDIPDFPEPGVVFKDVTPLLADGPAFSAVVRDIADRRRGTVDLVAGIEARGFIFGAAVAHELGIGFVPVRKAGKLPGKTRGVSYDLEYGSATIEIHEDSFVGDERVLVIDDVLATGGTAAATCELLDGANAEVVAIETVVELAFLHGRSRLEGRDTHTLIVVGGD